MQFSPLKFQIPLAAGGIALMAFNFLQFAVPHDKGLVKLADIQWDGLSAGQIALYLPLIVMMLAFSVMNLGTTAVYLKQLVQWRADKAAYRAFVTGPPLKSIGIFVPIASLSMTANVVLAPLAFFIPQLSSNLQAMMLPGLAFFCFLWLAIFRLEFRVLKASLSRPLDFDGLNFVWLLDVFAFGLVSLTGTGIAAMCANEVIASTAAFASLFTLSFGSFLLVVKLVSLIYHQIKAEGLPEKHILPSFFLVIPITCLYGFSYYRITLYLQTHFAYDMRMLSFFFLTFSYVVTIGWGLFCLYMLSSYFKRDFIKSDFAPTQWGLV